MRQCHQTKVVFIIVNNDYVFYKLDRRIGVSTVHQAIPGIPRVVLPSEIGFTFLDALFSRSSILLNKSWQSSCGGVEQYSEDEVVG